MTTDRAERENPSVSSQSGNARPRGKIKSNFANLDLPSFISQMLGQYQSLLVNQVERDVKDQALAAVKQEALVLQYEAAERLHLMETQVQKSVQAVLDLAQDRIFEMMRNEMKDIFSELDARLLTLLDDADLEGTATEPEDEQQDYVADSLVAQSVQPEDSATFNWEIDSPSDDRVSLPPAPQEIRLELPPPLDVRHLLGFYRGLSETKDVRILRSRGSLDRGVSFYIRPTRAEEVSRILQELPGVSDVRNEMAGDADSDSDKSHTYQIVLTQAA